MAKKLSHVDAAGNPAMVDVGHKSATHRVARAQAVVRVNKTIMALLKSGDINTKKGPVFATAILAGVMAAKRTSDLIPLCHPLPLEDCQVRVVPRGNTLIVETMASITGKTGVEMEALTAASVAALTIYDMCKAISHHITIESIQLMEKTGGKQDFRRKQ